MRRPRLRGGPRLQYKPGVYPQGGLLKATMVYPAHKAWSSEGMLTGVLGQLSGRVWGLPAWLTHPHGRALSGDR